MAFQIDYYDLGWALREELPVGIYLVRIAGATRDTKVPHKVRLDLEIAEGCHDGISLTFEFDEPHPGQSPRELRKCLRTLFAFGIVPSADGRYDFSLEDLIGRTCDAGMTNKGGTPQIWHDGLTPVDQ